MINHEFLFRTVSFSGTKPHIYSWAGYKKVWPTANAEGHTEKQAVR